MLLFCERKTNSRYFTIGKRHLDAQEALIEINKMNYHIRQLVEKEEE